MDIQSVLREISVVLLDMDGTIYLDETPIGDMQNTLRALRKANKQLVYCTNNSSKTAEEYVRKLKRIGFWEDGDLVYTSGMATQEYLNAFYADRTVYLVGTEELRSDFAQKGVKLLSESDADRGVIADVCVLAYDTSLTFGKLKNINRMIVRGAYYIATHPDDVCPSKEVFPPDVGSFIRLLECSSGKMPDLICGKPFTVMGDCLKRKLGIESNRILMVGDRLHTDIRFGVNNRFHTLLVMSGETTAEVLAYSPDRPECVLNSLNDAVQYL